MLKMRKCCFLMDKDCVSFKGTANVNVKWLIVTTQQTKKLELKSSKTRLLPSRSGVLIEFQSGVFTGNSRALSGLKLELISG